MAGVVTRGSRFFDFAIRVVSMISKIARPHLPADHTYSFSEHSLLWLLKVPSTAAQFFQSPGTCQGTEFSHMGLNKDLAMESLRAVRLWEVRGGESRHGGEERKLPTLCHFPHLMSFCVILFTASRKSIKTALIYGS